ncbi:hypothetical protein EGK_03436, partial [Macaca mulatta]
RNFAELKIKYLRKKFTHKCFERDEEDISMKKLKEYEQMYTTEIWMTRLTRKVGNFYIPAEPKLPFVIRTRSINVVRPKVQKVLQLLPLCQIINATFVKLNNASVNMLRIVEPYRALGYLNRKLVNELINRCGDVKISKRQIALTDIILVNIGIICMGRLIHEIYTLGKCFKSSSPRSGIKKKNTHFVEGRDSGNREDQINRFIRGTN